MTSEQKSTIILAGMLCFLLLVAITYAFAYEMISLDVKLQAIKLAPQNYTGTIK